MNAAQLEQTGSAESGAGKATFGFQAQARDRDGDGVLDDIGGKFQYNDHANGVAWLANRLAPHEVSLQAGEVILAGSFTKPVFALPGDTFVADYGPLGTVSCAFAREELS